MLLSDLSIVNNRIYENFMISNLGKCYFMSIGKDTHDNSVFNYENLTLKNSNEEEIFKKMCCKAGQKLCALLELCPYLDTNKRKTIYTIKIKFQLNYCLLVWMFCPRRSSNLINKDQERALPEVDAEGCHCCQCSTPKRLTLISRVETSFLKMLWTIFSNLTKGSCGQHCSKTLTSVA